MRILSLNVWGGRLHDRLLPYLAGADADVLCLQEVVRAPKARSDWLDYRDGDAVLAQRANLFEEVSRVLPSHRAYFCPAARGPLHDGNGVVASEWGLATFVRNTLPVIGQAQDFVHGDFSPCGWGEHPRARNAHAVRLFDEGAGRILSVAHLHGLRDPAGKGDSVARDLQAERLVGLIGRIRRDAEPLVVCGDFNVLPGSRILTALGNLGLTDLVTARGHADTRTSFYRKAPRFADYMLVSANVEVRDFSVVDSPEVSDHRALVVDIG